MKPDELTTENLGELLSELLQRDKPDPWQVCLVSSKSRAVAYQRLAAALGPRYERATFDNYEIYDRGDSTDRATQRQCFDAVREFCDTMPKSLQDGGGLVLFGRPGTGKDHLMAACMYWAILRHGFSVTWRDGSVLAQEVRDRISSSEPERELIERYTKSQILAISDLVPPKGDASAWVTDTLQRIVDSRYRSHKSTWATINVQDGREAERRLAPPLVDRLRHGSLCLQCEWDSYRGRSE